MSERTNKANQWKPSRESELAKLSTSLNGSSNAVTSRTRNGGRRRSPISNGHDGVGEVDLAAEDNQGAEENAATVTDNEAISASASAESDSSNDASDAGSNHPKKPPNTRVIMEVDELKKAMAMFARCPKCNKIMEFSLPTTCIATNIKFECPDKEKCTCWTDNT